MRAGVHRNLADVEYRRGHLAESQSHAEAAVEVLDALPNGRELQLGHALHLLACSALAQGRVDVGRSALRRAHAAAIETDPEITGLLAFADAQFAVGEPERKSHARRAVELFAPKMKDRAAAIEAWLAGAPEDWGRGALPLVLCVRAEELSAPSR